VTIFVDTGAWYALADRSDRHHETAAAFYLAQVGRAPFVTSSLVLSETFTLLSARLGRAAAPRFWDALREARIDVVPVDAADLEAAWRLAQAFPDQDFSVTDCTSFAVMERLGIGDAFAFDTHFLVYRYGRSRGKAFRLHPA
jgi:uncharacterized protein